MQNKFQALIQEQEEHLKKDSLRFDIIGYIKLSLVLLLGACAYLMFTRKFPLELIVIFIITLIVLSALWVYHYCLQNTINYEKGIIAICNQHIDRINGKWTAFEDIGAEYIDTDHAYACDLDIVGQKSLFRFLNTTHTWHGRQQFANDLLRPVYGCSDLRKRQEAIAELSSDIPYSNKIQYYLSKIGVDASAAELVEELKNDTPFIKNKTAGFGLRYLPVLTVLFIAGIIIFRQEELYYYGALLGAVQAVLWVAGMAKIHKYLGPMAHLTYRFSGYSEGIELLKSRDFSSEKLKQIQEQLNVAAQAVKDLNKIADKISLKNNLIIYFIINVLLLWDYECAFMLQEWKRKYAHLAEQWFLGIGEFESLLCFSHLPNVCDHTCLPVINAKGKIIEAEKMGHPLLLNEKRVNNGFDFSDQIGIISGSNMSGKTTFLRTIGINLVLARSGSFVCAETMNCSLLDIVTSMRIADDLKGGISTFYAELKRIRSILDAAENKTDTMFLIDEIFRGTNSIDRLTGAKTVIQKLNALGAVGLISTHDLELCDLAKGRIGNHSFSEYYKDKKICFDYKIKQGKSKTTNAKHLMELVGICPVDV